MYCELKVNNGMRIVLALAAMAAALIGQPYAFAQDKPSKPADSSKTVQAGAVTINMPEGMTKDQADQILQELKAIHQLLAKQQTAAAAPQPAPAPGADKVKMSVAPGWYSIGKDDAPVTMVEFADYQCPFCRKYFTETFTELKKNYIDTGKLRYVSRDLPLDFHPNAPGAAEAVRCAGAQGKFWQMRDMIIAPNADLTQDALIKYAEKLNLDVPAFRSCLTDKKYASAIQKDVADAGTVGISGTPSFVIGKTGKDQIDGVRIVGAVPYSVFEGAINGQLDATAKP